MEQAGVDDRFDPRGRGGTDHRPVLRDPAADFVRGDQQHPLSALQSALSTESGSS